jgi:hypothetical protein
VEEAVRQLVALAEIQELVEEWERLLARGG